MPTGGNTNDRVETAYSGDRYLDHDERYEIFVVKAAERPHLLRWRASSSSSSSSWEGEKEGGRIERLGNDDRRRDHDEKKSDDGYEGDIALPDPSSPSLIPPPPPPPLTDGTDLPGWRCRRIAPCMDGCRRRSIHRRCPGRLADDVVVVDDDNDDDVDIEFPLGGVLNVGVGSTLFRRDDQLPCIVGSATRPPPPPLDDDDDDDDDGVRTYHDRDYRCCRWHVDRRERWFDVPPHPDRAVPIIEYDVACALVNNDDRAPDAHTTTTTTTTTNATSRRGNEITYFAREYERANRPAKILGATVGWSAMPSYVDDEDNDDVYENHATTDVVDGTVGWSDVNPDSLTFTGGGRGGWTFGNLLSRYGDVAFRFSDSHGEMLPLSTYARYMINPEGTSDDSPLGIYDSMFGDLASPTRDMVHEYHVPRCFGPDLFDLAVDDDDDDGLGIDEDDNDGLSQDAERHQKTAHRPPYRWILIGPERSGTGMHVDPLWTSAWVTVLQGRKRWLLFPPETPYDMIGMIESAPQIPSSIWFRDYYHIVTSPAWPDRYRPREVEQYPGETVYVPAGWPHLVLNLELTVAITHNYAPEYGPFLDRTWMQTARDEPDFARRWRAGLSRNGREDLASRMGGGWVDFDRDDAPLRIRGGEREASHQSMP
ncbi:hypothetical protein ACHAXA_011676 [Cyclostephanos tholiformis]|uniref:JmjC domain-containing protein n=1 Tax=Cyclostephanos tholiformis TaxID=382380 RepID=A0ABD3SEV0_9STRA